MRPKVVSLGSRGRRHEHTRPHGGPSWQVRLPDPDTPERTLGCGILIGPRHVLTTTHAVAHARPAGEGIASDGLGEVIVEFPLVAGEASSRAVVTSWLPESTGGSGIVILALLQPPPPDARVARFAALPVSGCANRAVDYFGFANTSPSGRQLRAYCVRGQAPASVRVELSADAQHPELCLDGAGVWDPVSEAVLGMLDAHADEPRSGGVLRMIPTRDLSRAYHGLDLLPQQGALPWLARLISTFDTRLGHRLLQAVAGVSLAGVGLVWWLEPDAPAQAPPDARGVLTSTAARAIVGMVTDTDGLPVPHARVLVPALGLEEHTDPAGRFVLRLATPRGRWVEVIVVAAGFGVTSARLAPGEAAVAIRLEPMRTPGSD